MTFADVEVRTRSLVTAATLLLLGHEPLEIRRDANGVQFRFAPSAETDLKRYFAAKQQVEHLIDTA
jgi:hypothetical protein